MRPGQTFRFDCDECLTEFEVCLEPKAKESKEGAKMEPDDVKHCPFCGSDSVHTEDE